MAGYRIEVRKLNTAGTVIITYQIPVFDNTDPVGSAAAATSGLRDPK